MRTSNGHRIMSKLARIFPILNTTFNEEGGLDLARQASLVNYLLKYGPHGLGLC
jgi:dihydrodipicolinate synthase/N-acetylneuraminate lyase